MPALALKVGFDKGSPEERIQTKWLTTSATMRRRTTWRSRSTSRPPGHFDVLVARLLERVANRDSRPRWKDSSFFKRFAK